MHPVTVNVFGSAVVPRGTVPPWSPRSQIPLAHTKGLVPPPVWVLFAQLAGFSWSEPVWVAQLSAVN